MRTDHVHPPQGRPYGAPDAQGILVFVLLGVAAAWDTAAGLSRPAWLAWPALAAATALYAAAVLPALRRGPAPTPAGLAALTALTAVVTAAAAHFGGGWLYLFPMAGIACGAVLYGRRVRIALLPGVVQFSDEGVLVPEERDDDPGAERPPGEGHDRLQSSAAPPHHQRRHPGQGQ